MTSLRTFSNLVAAILAAHLIARSRTWFEGVPNTQAHLEAILLGVLSALLIVSLISLIKLILGRFLLSTRDEVLVAHFPRYISASDESHHPGDLYSQVESPVDQRRKFFMVDTLEIEMHEEMV